VSVTVRRSNHLGYVAAAAALVVSATCAEPSTSPARPSESAAASWPTWVLPGASALRPAAPPAEGSPQAAAELQEVATLQRQRTAVDDSLMRVFDGDPTSFWTRAAVDRLGFYWALLPDVRIATPARSARMMALLHVAQYDAAIAAWDAKWAYRRRAPAGSGGVSALVPVGDVPSYPSEHAAVAAASYAILAATGLPGDTVQLRTWRTQAAQARLVAGAARRSDVEAGLALGAAVAARVLQRAATDGSAQLWTGSVPAGPHFWKPTPARRVAIPFDALAGNWRPWVIASGSAFRPPPPPLPGSPAFEANMSEMRQLAAGGRTEAQMNRARYWATEAPTARWDLFMEEELARLRPSVPRAARARAYLSVAMFDAFVACWDAKYHYWLARPITMDPTMNTVFSTPPFPSYPSGHSTISTAASQVMEELFPARAKHYHDLAIEASNSRVWGGVHYRFDIEMGDTLGTRVGKAVVARMRGEGITPR